MGKLTSAEWWLGRTPEQQQRSETARQNAKARFAQVGANTRGLGGNMAGLGLRITGVVLLLAIAVPILFVCGAVVTQ